MDTDGQDFCIHLIRLLADAIKIRFKLQLFSDKKSVDRKILTVTQECLNEKLAELAGLPLTIRSSVPYWYELQKWMVDIKDSHDDHLSQPFPNTQFTLTDYLNILRKIESLQSMAQSLFQRTALGNMIVRKKSISGTLSSIRAPSRGDRQVEIPVLTMLTSATISRAHSEELEEGEIWELAPTRPRKVCSELEHRVSEFQLSRGDHVAMLDRVRDKLEAASRDSSAFSKRLRAIDVSRSSEKILSVLGSVSVWDMLKAESGNYVDEARSAIILQLVTQQAIAYEMVWNSLQGAIAITNVVAPRL